MSRFSGKCDFYDFIEIHGFDYIKNSDIYIGHDFNKEKKEIIPGKKLEINSVKDLIPYYPYIISASSSNAERATVYLTEKSWPDIKREEMGDVFQMYDFYQKELEKELEKYESKEELEI